MFDTVIVLVAGGIVGLIFLRKYLHSERGMHIRDFVFKKRNPHLKVLKDEPASEEITADEMISSSDDIDAKNSAKASILVKKAETKLERGELKEATALLIEALSLDPGSVKSHEKLALCFVHQGNFGKAENIYRKLVLTVTDDPTYYSNLGMALYSQEKFDEARNFYMKALELDDSKAGRYFSLAQVHRELDEIEDAIANFKAAIERDPRNKDYLLSLARFYLDVGYKDDAGQILAEILLVAPSDEIALEMKKELDLS